MAVTKEACPKSFASASGAFGAAFPNAAIDVIGIIAIIERVFSLFQNCFGNQAQQEARAKRRIKKLATSKKERRRDKGADYMLAAVKDAHPEWPGHRQRIVTAEIMEDWRYKSDAEFDDMFAEVAASSS